MVKTRIDSFRSKSELDRVGGKEKNSMMAKRSNPRKELRKLGGGGGKFLGRRGPSAPKEGQAVIT